MVLDIIGLEYGFSRSYRASTERVSTIQIPIPSTDIQDKIIKACKKVKEEFNSSRMSLDNYREKITAILYKNKVLIKE